MKIFFIFKANGLSPEDPLLKTLREELTICLSSLNVDVSLNFFTDKGLLTGTQIDPGHTNRKGGAAKGKMLTCGRKHSRLRTVSSWLICRTGVTFSRFSTERKKSARQAQKGHVREKNMGVLIFVSFLNCAASLCEIDVYWTSNMTSLPIFYINYKTLIGFAKMIDLWLDFKKVCFRQIRPEGKSIV